MQYQIVMRRKINNKNMIDYKLLEILEDEILKI